MDAIPYPQGIKYTLTSWHTIKINLNFSEFILKCCELKFKSIWNVLKDFNQTHTL